MLRDIVHGDVEARRDLTHGSLTLSKPVHDRQTMLVRQRFAQLGMHREEGPGVGRWCRAIGSAVVLYLHVCLYTQQKAGCQVQVSLMGSGYRMRFAIRPAANGLDTGFNLLTSAPLRPSVKRTLIMHVPYAGRWGAES